MLIGPKSNSKKWCAKMEKMCSELEIQIAYFSNIYNCSSKLVAALTSSRSVCNNSY